MRQIRITSANFVHQGETGDADAVMDAKDLAEIKRLAGLTITEDEGASSPSVGGVVGQINNVPLAGETGIESPVGSNISYTAQERRQLEDEFQAKPGDDLWFVINFTKPFFNGSLRAHVEDYLKKHPEVRPRPAPGA